jgi:hypothetical protein
MPWRDRAAPARKGHPTSIPCGSCRFMIPFVLRPGRYALGCPECDAQTPIEVFLRQGRLRVVRLGSGQGPPSTLIGRAPAGPDENH